MLNKSASVNKIFDQGINIGVPVAYYTDQWWRDLFRCRIDLLNFSMGFNIIAPYMEFLHLNWYIAEWYGMRFIAYVVSCTYFMSLLCVNLTLHWSTIQLEIPIWISIQLWIPTLVWYSTFGMQNLGLILVSQEKLKKSLVFCYVME